MSRYEFDPNPRVIRVPVTLSDPRENRIVRAIFDPGAASVIVHTPLAIRLGYDLASAPEESIMTAGGPSTGRRIVLKCVKALGEKALEVPALCVPLRPELKAQALLGNTFLRHFVVTFSLQRGFLELWPVDSAGTGGPFGAGSPSPPRA